MLNSFLTHLQEGMYHVLNLRAYDHILFLVVLSIPYLFKDWKRVLMLVTVFTIGHSLSLALATYDVISVNNKLVEFLIPITILIVALFNVFTSGKKSGHEKVGLLFFTTLFFGLIHGLGFASVFESIVKSSENKVAVLLEFALGIELGQLIVVFIVLFISFLCQTIFRFSKRDWILVISSVVAGLLIPMLLRSEMIS